MDCSEANYGNTLMFISLRIIFAINTNNNNVDVCVLNMTVRKRDQTEILKTYAIDDDRCGNLSKIKRNMSSFQVIEANRIFLYCVMNA